MLLWPASLDGFREEVNNTTEPPGNFARSMNAAFPLCHWERYWATNSQLSDSPFGKTLPGWEVVPMSSDRTYRFARIARALYAGAGSRPKSICYWHNPRQY